MIEVHLGPKILCKALADGGRPAVHPHDGIVQWLACKSRGLLDCVTHLVDEQQGMGTQS